MRKCNGSKLGQIWQKCVFKVLHGEPVSGTVLVPAARYSINGKNGINRTVGIYPICTLFVQKFCTGSFYYFLEIFITYLFIYLIYK